jgi:hypothetical protein
MTKLLATLLIACFTISAGIATIGCSGDTKKKDDSDKPKTDDKPIPGETDAVANPADEASAVKTVEKLGGSVTVDDKQSGKSIVKVSFLFIKVTDADLKRLKELKELKSLHQLELSYTKITDAGLKELKEFESLQRLWLQGTAVTDAGLKELKTLKRLQFLNLADTKVTDVGLKELKELKSLQVLHLTGTKVTDAGVKELAAALPELGIMKVR